MRKSSAFIQWIAPATSKLIRAASDLALLLNMATRLTFLFLIFLTFTVMVEDISAMSDTAHLMPSISCFCPVSLPPDIYTIRRYRYDTLRCSLPEEMSITTQLPVLLWVLYLVQNCIRHNHWLHWNLIWNWWIMRSNQMDIGLIERRTIRKCGYWSLDTRRKLQKGEFHTSCSTSVIGQLCSRQLFSNVHCLCNSLIVESARHLV